METLDPTQQYTNTAGLISDVSNSISPTPAAINQQVLITIGSSIIMLENHSDERNDHPGGRWAVVLLDPRDTEKLKRSPEHIQIRNAIARKNPAALSNLVNAAVRTRAAKEGSYIDRENVVSFNPSEIPFHLAYSISCEHGPLYHLVSGKNRRALNPGSRRPHFPFYDKGEGDDIETRQQRSQKTIETAQLILSRHGSIAEADLPTAEYTAQLVNNGKIDMDLLLYLATPKVKLKTIHLKSCDKNEAAKMVTASVDNLEKQSIVEASPSKPPAKLKKQRKRKKKKSTGFHQQSITDGIRLCREDPHMDNNLKSLEETADKHAIDICESTPLKPDEEPDSAILITSLDSTQQTTKLGANSIPTIPDSFHDDYADNEAPFTDRLNDGDDAFSDASLEQFYTPQASQHTSPNIQLRTDVRAHVTPLKQELIAEKDALEGESTEWEITPEEVVERLQDVTPTYIPQRSVCFKAAESFIPWTDSQVSVEAIRTSEEDAAKSLSEVSCGAGNILEASTQIAPDCEGHNDDAVFSPEYYKALDHESAGTDIHHKDSPSEVSRSPKIFPLEDASGPKKRCWKYPPKELRMAKSQRVLRYGKFCLSTWVKDDVVDDFNVRYGMHDFVPEEGPTSDSHCRNSSWRTNGIEYSIDGSARTTAGKEAEPQRERLQLKSRNQVRRTRNLLLTTRERRAGRTSKEKPTTPPFDNLITEDGPQGVMWAYYTHTPADRQIRDAGVWLWEKPPTYFEPLLLRAKQVDGITVPAPAIVARNSIHNPREPIVTFDGNVIHITPHFPPWPDIRSDVGHPDFLPCFKLAEYQACEAAGYRVWRHDRDFLTCARETCGKIISDYNTETKVCPGCGPKSSVRYCSLGHELEDLNEHWNNCGDPNLTMQCIIDHTTAPDAFDNLCPRIKERHGVKSFALHRQRFFAYHCHGHYTLFAPTNQKHATLAWPKTYPNWQEMDRRIERLLNVALFDIWRHSTLSYLYRLLRHLISITPLNSAECLQNLKTQFGAEFGTHIFKTTDSEPIFPCECEWYGQGMDSTLHLQSCRYKNEEAAGSDPDKSGGLLKQVVRMEARCWILRAWAQQHPSVSSWRDRANGTGFEGVICRGMDIRLGPGFVGWGADADNICM
ncbi:MAG: hypothetical protein Q9217_003495 [Psora testacea]